MAKEKLALNDSEIALIRQFIKVSAKRDLRIAHEMESVAISLKNKPSTRSISQLTEKIDRIIHDVTQYGIKDITILSKRTCINGKYYTSLHIVAKYMEFGHRTNLTKIRETNVTRIIGKCIAIIINEATFRNESVQEKINRLLLFKELTNKLITEIGKTQV